MKPCVGNKEEEGEGKKNKNKSRSESNCRFSRPRTHKRETPRNYRVRRTKITLLFPMSHYDGWGNGVFGPKWSELCFKTKRCTCLCGESWKREFVPWSDCNGFLATWVKAAAYSFLIPSLPTILPTVACLAPPIHQSYVGNSTQTSGRGQKVWEW